jgi:hypothetical protein
MPVVDWEVRSTTRYRHDDGSGSIVVSTGEGDEGWLYRLWIKSAVTEATLIIDASGQSIRVSSMEERFWPSIVTVLLGPGLGLVVRLRGDLCLHASVVSLGGKAVALLGHKGIGKSTLAAALGKRGHPVLSDDLAVVTTSASGYLIQPGYPRMRLWPDTIRALHGSEEGLPRVLPIFSKRYMELETAHEARDGEPWVFQTEALPLGSLYRLDDAPPELPVPTIEPIPPAQALVMLTAHVYARLFPLEKQAQAREFLRLGALATAVPVRHISRPRDLQRLSDLCDALEQDAALLHDVIYHE